MWRRPLRHITSQALAIPKPRSILPPSLHPSQPPFARPPSTVRPALAACPSALLAPRPSGAPVPLRPDFRLPRTRLVPWPVRRPPCTCSVPQPVRAPPATPFYAPAHLPPAAHLLGAPARSHAACISTLPAAPPRPPSARRSTCARYCAALPWVPDRPPHACLPPRPDRALLRVGPLAYAPSPPLPSPLTLLAAAIRLPLPHQCRLPPLHPCPLRPSHERPFAAQPVPTPGTGSARLPFRGRSCPSGRVRARSAWLAGWVADLLAGGLVEGCVTSGATGRVTR